MKKKEEKAGEEVGQTQQRQEETPAQAYIQCWREEQQQQDDLGLVVKGKPGTTEDQGATV